MSTQVQQVFYIQDPVEKHLHYPIKRVSTDISDAQDDNDVIEDDINGQFSHDMNFNSFIKNRDDEVDWFRDNIPITKIPIPFKTIEKTRCEFGKVYDYNLMSYFYVSCVNLSFTVSIVL